MSDDAPIEMFGRHGQPLSPCPKCNKRTDINRRLCQHCEEMKYDTERRPRDDPDFGKDTHRWGACGYCRTCKDECWVLYGGKCSYCYGEERGRPSWGIYSAKDLPKVGEPLPDHIILRNPYNGGEK